MSWLSMNAKLTFFHGAYICLCFLLGHFKCFFFANLLRTLECLFVNISIRVIGHVRRIRCTH